MELYHYYPGRIPFIVSIPHAGTFVPASILERFTDSAKQLPDTDWHVPELYAFAREMGVHLLIATHSRYVVDLNRDPNGSSLYPGMFTTDLCPTTLFDGSPMYLPNQACTPEEVKHRIQTYWQPYHKKLRTILDELSNQTVVLLDAHSIRSQVPTLFSGTLPDLNIGTADGTSASDELATKFFEVCQKSPYSSVYNGRFKGGYITRHYGQPAKNIHAIQLELAQNNYMQETYPFTYQNEKASNLQTSLNSLFSLILNWIGHEKKIDF